MSQASSLIADLKQQVQALRERQEAEAAALALTCIQSLKETLGYESATLDIDERRCVLNIPLPNGEGAEGVLEVILDHYYMDEDPPLYNLGGPRVDGYASGGIHEGIGVLAYRAQRRADELQKRLTEAQVYARAYAILRDEIQSKIPPLPEEPEEDTKE